jgi:hypothetical protein
VTVAHVTNNKFVLANVLASGIFVYTANDVLSRWSTDSTIDEMP